MGDVGALSMQLPVQLNDRFDPLIAGERQIHERNEASGSALLVIQDGTIVTEHYAGYHSHEPGARIVQADSQFLVASVRKSYVGLVMAMALHAGAIADIDDPVTRYLPDLYTDLLPGTRIRHLLTHTHGLARDEKRQVIREFAPGTSWGYENIAIELLTTIIRRTMGKSVAQILREHLFDPLGFSETGWRTEEDERLVPVIRSQQAPPDPHLHGGTDGDGDQRNLFVSTRELAYWGYIHLTRGLVDDRQVLPAELFALTTTRQSPVDLDPDLPQNGFLWFVQDQPSRQTELGERLPVGSFQIVGVTGPLVLVVPAHNLVVVRMSNKLYNFGGENYLYYLREFGNQVMACLEA